MEASLYIHIPFCRQKCDYCDFFSIGEKDRLGRKNDISDDYIRSVVNEAKFYADFYCIKSWSSIYLGGGTPGILSEKQLFDLIYGVKNACVEIRNQKSEIINASGARQADVEREAGKSNYEITVEVNPENVTEEKIKILEKAGVNRISMGIQAVDDKALRAVNRKSDVKTIFSALSIFEKFWGGRLGVDFIAGLPNQTYESFKNQFEILDDFKKIGHVSLYTLTIEENTPLAKKIDSGKIRFSADKADKMWILGRNILEKKGFLQYEVSNFARPGDESVHNSSYWKQKNYIGCGSGAVGTIYDFEAKKALRWTNTYSIPKYVEFWKNPQIQKKAQELKGCALKLSKEEKNLLAPLTILENPCSSVFISIESLKNLPASLETLDESTLEFEFLMTGFRQLSGVSSKEYFTRFGKHLEERIGAESGVFAKWRKMRLARVKKSENDKIYSLNKRGILLLNRFLEELL